MKKIDYYEFLQISPNADHDTIHRVYRFLAARFHPDNPRSADAEKFAMLTQAYEVLSDPMRRIEYDADCQREAAEQAPLSSTIDFMDHLEGETNRRLAVLAVLYYRRRTNPQKPEVSLYEIEARMGFPRDYLDFTTWYLLRKGYITRADNSDFTLTAEGVDYVETQRVSLPILNKLLTSGSELESEPAAPRPRAAAAPVTIVPPPATKAARNGSKLTVKEAEPSSIALCDDRRLSMKDRRTGTHDRRSSGRDRRTNS
jgi:curved DNA-binding protein CbpA